MLGVSLYPDQTQLADDLVYLEAAKRCGFQLVFMSFLQIDVNNPKKSVDRIRETIKHVREMGMEVTLDIHPMVFDYIQASFDDLAYFSDLKVSTIRLDVGFNGRKEALMTHNPYGLNIEVNMSNETNYLDLIHSYYPDRSRLRGSHNFYPQRYTGLSLDSFIRCSTKFQAYHIQSSAFITSHAAKLMPWPVSEGHCTLEMHRDLPIEVQARHMKMLGMVDHVIIGNAYASIEELEAVSKVYHEPMDVLDIEFYEDASELEKEMVLKYKHEYRGDHSPYVIRSSKNRGRYHGVKLPPHSKARKIHRGDILLLNEDYGQYKSEVQIALCDREQDPRINVVGRVCPEEMILIDHLKPFQAFMLQEKQVDKAKYYIGVDIGGTRVKLGLVDERGKLLNTENVETKKEKHELFDTIKTFIKRQGVAIEGIGLSTPGIVTNEGFMQTSGAIKCFFKQPIKAELQEYLGYPVVIENDGRCAALAEKWIGAAVADDDFVCITLGTAIGGAIFMDGRLRRGLGGLAGEFGVSLSGLSKDVYDEQSFAYHAATVGGLCRQYSYAIKQPVLDAKEILSRARAGDEVAKEKVHDFIYAVATLCINIATTIAPKTIYIGGGISANAEVMDEIFVLYDKMCREYHVLSLLEMPKLRTCQLKNDAGMIGAVYSFIKRK